MNGKREKLFPAVHSSYQFALISLTERGMREDAAQFAFFLGHPDELAVGGTVFALSPEEIALINPNTGTLPVFRTRRDADLTAAIQRRVPVLVREGQEEGNPWGITFKNFFNMTDDSDLFRSRATLAAEGWDLEGSVFVRDGKRMLPLYEGKMAHLFDHRWNRYHGPGNDDYQPVLSEVFDFVARQKVGGIHMGLMTWKQLPVPHPDDLAPHIAFITPRVLELVYSCWEMEPLGDTGAPFAWNEDRRTQLRAELDAYFLHLYGVSREDADYILESFQTENGGLKNNETAKYGEYRTKRLVLTEYDRMAEAGLTMETPLIDGKSYMSALTPPPGQGPRHEARPEAG